MKIDGFDSKYRYIHVAARRARQLQSGAPALVKTESRKASKVAQAEIDAGLVNFTSEEKKATPLTPAETHFDGGSH